MSTLERVKNVVAQSLGLPESEITAKSSLRADLNADSLELAQLIIDLEDEFGCEIPDDDVQALFTVGDIVKYADSHCH